MMLRVQIFTWSCWVNTAMSVAMAGFVLASRPLTKTKIYWALTCVAVAVWSFGLGYLGASETEAGALLGIAIDHLGAAFIPVFLLQTVTTLIRKKYGTLLILSYLSAFAMQYLNLTHKLFWAAPASAGFRFFTAPLPGYVFFIAHLYLLFIVLEIILWVNARRASPVFKKQLLLLFWGTTLGFIGGQTAIPVMYGIPLFPWGVLFVPLYIVFVGYAMLKYQFMDYKAAAKKLIVTVLIYAVLALVVTPFLSPLIKTVYAANPTIFPLVGVISVILALLLAAGPVVYSLLMRHSFWLRGDLSMSLVHELKSPLGTIQSASEILSENLRRSKFDRAEALDYIAMIQKNSERLEAFTKELLDVAHIQEGNVTIETESVDLVRIIKDIVETFRIPARQKKITLRTELEKLPMIEGDEKKLTIVVSNLLSNALKFSDGGTISIILAQDPGHIRCSVKDDGRGIPREHLERVFERFFQAHKGSKGSGLGLAIAKGWIEAHGGKIWAESAGEGNGTTITFTLPV